MQREIYEQVKKEITISDWIRQDIHLVKEGIGWKGKCPFHPDNTPSLSVVDMKGIFKCFGCGAGGDVFDWLEKKRGLNRQETFELLGGTHLIKRRQPLPGEEPARIPAGAIPFFFRGTPDTIYTYRDREGDPIYYIGRYEANPDKKRERKEFIPAYYSAAKKWINKALKPQPLYGLERIHLPGLIILVEGEKCRDALQALMPDRAVMTWPGGTGQIQNADWLPLLDREILYWPDNDENGQKSINQIAKYFGKILVVNIPKDAPEKWDVSDAIENGWSNKQIEEVLKDRFEYHYRTEAEQELDEIDLDDLEEAHQEEVEFPRQLLDKIPGLVGEMYQYIMDTSIHPQPLYALPAALTAVGVLYGHKIATKTDLRTNLYTLGVGPSGSGKDHARKCINHLFLSAGLKNNLVGDPKSKAGVLSSLKDSGGKCLTLIDEAGRLFKAINSKYSNHHVAQIADVYIKLFSSASTYFAGERGANYDGRNPAVNLDQPCLGVYGTTVKEHLFESMSSKDAIDGFLSRWLVFETFTPFVEEREPLLALRDIPESLLTKVKTWKHLPTNNYANNEAEANLFIAPKHIPFTKEAEEIRVAFKQEVRPKRESDNFITAALWKRASEHADKIALCLHENQMINGHVMQWAVELVKYCIKKMEYEIHRHVSDNEYESILKRVLEIIRKDRKITKSKLVRKTQWLPMKSRDDILQNLIESQMVLKIHEKSNAKAKKKTEIYCYVPALKKN
jgi:hypothetical protein